MGKRALLSMLALVVAGAASSGQHEWPRSEVAARFAEQNLDVGAAGGDRDTLVGPAFSVAAGSYLDELADICSFLDRLQRKNLSDPQFGGMAPGHFQHLPSDAARAAQNSNPLHRPIPPNLRVLF